MVKKVLALALGLALAVSTMAQWGSGNPTVPQSDIQFWTGTGSNRAVIAVTWEDDNEDLIGIAWGVQWNGGSIMLKSLMDTIAAYDSRFNVTYSSPSWLDNITYNDTDLGLNLVGTAGWWWYNWKNSADVDYQSSGVAADMIQNGDFVDWMQTGAADTMIMASDPNAPVDPLPEDAEIAASDIIYWVGEGNNKVVFAINWADTALAWGYQFSTDSVYVSEIIDALVAADPRLSIEGTSSFVSDFRYADENITDTLTITPHAADDYSIYFNMQVNHVSSMVGAAGHAVVNGDFVKFADTYAAVKVDSTWIADWSYWDYTYVWPMAIHPVSVPATPVDPTPEDAEIAASDIIYWVGEGSNKVVFAINWADTALAWGYQFSTDSVYVSEIIDALVAADPRLSIEGTSSFVSDFRYADENITDTLTITPHAADDYSIYFNMQVNHVSSMVGAAGHAVVNGDFVKFADTYAAVKVDSTWIADWSYWDYTYVWPMAIHPVSVPQSQGITVAEGMSVSVYPNPAVSSVKVSFSALENASDIELFDMTGRRVAAMAVAAGSTEAQIAVDGLANGVYLLRMADATAKVIVRK